MKTGTVDPRDSGKNRSNVAREESRLASSPPSLQLVPPWECGEMELPGLELNETLEDLRLQDRLFFTHGNLKAASPAEEGGIRLGVCFQGNAIVSFLEQKELAKETK